jgi:DIS3-like exonuclease 2
VIEERMDSNFMVEEFMLLANKLIGKFMVGSCKELSLLRKHEFPKEEKLSRFKDFCK